MRFSDQWQGRCAEKSSVRAGISNLHATPPSLRFDCAMCLMAQAFARLCRPPRDGGAPAALLKRQQPRRILVANSAVRGGAARPAGALPRA
jgi:hypothetical protein